MDLSQLRTKQVAVLGYGMEGKATANYLQKHGVTPVLFDHRPLDAFPKDVQTDIKTKKIAFIFGPDCLKELAGFDIAFRSPGIKRNDPDLLREEKKGLVVSSQTKWFFDNCPAKIIGVTGTKGKGTTASLIYKILEADHRSKIYLTGNIGKIQLFEFLDELAGDETVVCELSSFQLQDLNRSPHIGVVLMTTSEHLNYHASEEEYVNAKSSIVKYQVNSDFAVISADYKNSMLIGRQGEGGKFYFSRKMSAGMDCYAKEGSIFLRDRQGRENMILPVSSLQLRGAHNLENVCAALLAAHLAEAGNDSLASAAANFKGLEHRLEFAGEHGGIKYYNDSFSTTPETAIAAIRSFSEPLIVILGGSEKSSNFSELGRAIAESPNIKGIVLIGQTAQKIKSAATGAGYKGRYLEGANNMKKILDQARSIAKTGDVILLSPACASFDMFENYKQRGIKFKEELISNG